MTPERTDERLDAMQATIDELREQVARLSARAPSTANSGSADAHVEPEVSRRHALRAAGVLAAGAIAGGVGVLATAAPAAAATGYFDSSNPIDPAAEAWGSNGAIGFKGHSDTNAGVLGEGRTGVLGVSTETGYPGVWGINNSGVGVYARGLRGVDVAGDEVSIRFSPVSHRSASPVAGDLIFDSSGDMWLCTGVGVSPPAPIWRKVTGSTTAGSFHPVTPGRVYDSRIAGGGIGPIARGETRTVSVANRIVNGATPALTSFVPSGAVAVTMNLTITTTVGSGNLAVNPGGDTLAHASTINWSAGGQVAANSTVVAVDSSRQVTVVANGPLGSSTNFIIDVLGYWL